MNQRLMAFWKYDLFPYLLCGEIESFEKGGLVYVPSYQGTLTPVMVLPLEDGLALKDELDQLKSLMNRDLESVRKYYRKELKKTLSKYPTYKPK